MTTVEKAIFTGTGWRVFEGGTGQQNRPVVVPPTVDFTASVDVETVAFTSLATAGSASIGSQQWDFGDGQQGTGDTVSHVYPSAGAWYPTLTVTDVDGGTASVSKSVTTTPPPPPPDPAPTCSLGSPTTSGATVTVTPTAADADGTITSLILDWGDGIKTSQSVANGTAVSYTYASSGPFTVRLTATANDGATGTASVVVNPTVTPPPPPPPTGTAVIDPWKTGTVDEGLPSTVPIYKARTLQPSGTLELQTMINALPGPGLIDISGQEVWVSSYSNGANSGAYGTKWRGLIGDLTNGVFGNQLKVKDHCMAASIVAAIQAQQTAFTTSVYAAVRLDGGTAPFYWMGVHMIGADQGQVTESTANGAQVSPVPARGHGVDFGLSGTGTIIQNSLFEGVNAASGSKPPWEVGALDFRRSLSQILRRVEVSGILPVGSDSRPQATTADPYGRGWKRSGGIQYNADKSPVLEDVSLHDTLVSGLTFSIAGSSNNGSNNSQNLLGTRLFMQNNSEYGFPCINNEVVLGPVMWDHPTLKAYSTGPHITVANNTGFGTIVPDIPSSQYQVIEPIWSGGGAGAMFQIKVNTSGGQKSYPTVVKNGVTLQPSLTTGKDPTKFYHVKAV